MSANGKVAEPSMDDILASIRRIISEDPKAGGVRPPVAAQPPVSRETAPTDFSAQFAEAEARRSAQAQAQSQARSAPTLPAAAPAQTSAPAWDGLGLPMAKPGTAPPLATVPSPSTVAAPSTAAVPAPVSSPVPMPLPQQNVARTANLGGSLGDDLASLIGAVRASSVGSAAGQPPVAPAQPPVQSPPPVFSALPQPASAAPIPSVAPAPAAVAAPATGLFGADARARGIDAAIGAFAAASGGSASVEAKADLTRAAAAIKAAPEVGANVVGSEGPQIRSDAMTAATTVTEPVAAKVEPVVQSAAKAEPAAAEQVASPKLPAPFATLPAPLPVGAAVPSTKSAARTMEDTVAELLRPLLRDWLDENMPQIVEKAMKAELAERDKGRQPSKPN